jgi:hypothetical protein
MTQDKLYTSDTKGTLGILAFSSITTIQLRRITAYSPLLPTNLHDTNIVVQVDDEIVDLPYAVVASSTLHVDETGCAAMDSEILVVDPTPGYYYCIYHSGILQCSTPVSRCHLIFYVDGLTPLRYKF